MVTNSWPVSSGQWGSAVVPAQSSFPWWDPSSASTPPYFEKLPQRHQAPCTIAAPPPWLQCGSPLSAASHPFLPSFRCEVKATEGLLSKEFPISCLLMAGASQTETSPPLPAPPWGLDGEEGGLHVREGVGGLCKMNGFQTVGSSCLPVCLDPREQKRKSALISALDRAGL